MKLDTPAIMRRSLLVLVLVLAAALVSCAKRSPESPVAQHAKPEQATQAKPETIEKVLVQGAELAYIQRGTGTPVVFVHGSLGDLMTFSPQFEAFSNRYYTVAYSRRFHPPNQPPAKDSVYSAALHADDLAAMIETLGLRPAHIVASSYGAYTALMLALKHPSSVRSLVLGEPPVFPLIWKTAAGEPVFKDFEANVLVPARRAFGRGDLEDGLRQFIDGVTAKKGNFDRIPPPGRAELLTFGPEMSSEMLTDPARYFPAVSCDDLKAMTIPTLLVTGENSARFLHQIDDELARCLPSPERLSIPQAGHSMHLDDPATYNDKVLGFLAAH